MNFKVRIFPLIKKSVVLNTSKRKFFSALANSTEKNFDLLRNIDSNNFNTKYYEADLFDDDFRCRKIGVGYRRFLGTTIYGKIKENDGSITFKYVIMSNVFTSLYLILFLFGIFYFITDSIILGKIENLTNIFTILIFYLVIVFMLSDNIEEDKEFVSNVISNLEKNSESK